MRLQIFIILFLLIVNKAVTQEVPYGYVACYQVFFDASSLAKEFRHNESSKIFRCKDYRELSVERTITDAVVNGDVRAFDSNAFKEDYPAVYSVLYMRIKDIKKRMRYTIDTVWMGDPTESGTLYSINKEVDPSELKSAVCIEKWTFNKKNTSFIKEVLAFKPVRHHYDSADTEKKDLMLSNVYGLDMTRYGALEEIDESYLVRSKTVSYEYFLQKPEICAETERASTENLLYTNSLKLKPAQSLFFTNDQKDDFVSSMVDFAQNGKHQVYDFYTGKQLASGAISAKLAGGEVKSVVFIEDWYIDTETFYLVKKVLGVAPVVHKTDEREVAFVIFFDDERRQGLELADFFDRK